MAYQDPVTKNRYVFVTNNTTWVAQTIADIYKSRWQILGQATPEDAPALLDEWLEWAARSRLTPFVKLGRTIRKHAEGILAYLDTKITNGPVEGINNKLRVIAVMCLRGNVVRQDRDEAERLLRPAAAQGYEFAFYVLDGFAKVKGVNGDEHALWKATHFTPVDGTPTGVKCNVAKERKGYRMRTQRSTVWSWRFTAFAVGLVMVCVVWPGLFREALQAQGARRIEVTGARTAADSGRRVALVIAAHYLAVPPPNTQ